MLSKRPPSSSRDSESTAGLNSLPYDLLLNIATFLDLRDVHALHLTCRSFYDASTTRTVYRKLANDLLRRCRALPLKGFQRLADLTTEQLIRSVNKATHYENAWRSRSPKPIPPESQDDLGIHAHSNYLDVTPGGLLAKKMKKEGPRWYKVVSAPPGEEVDWLSPITSSYTLCATKSGKVVCWDVQTDACLAEWNPGARWELWKCRVEFEERAVFFTMAKVLAGSYDDDRIMEFVLMRLAFSDGSSGESSLLCPTFSHVTDFRTAGVVMNVFLLDPSERLLSAFIWVSAHNTIGLYALPDWDKNEYVFIDTGIECVMSSNWSCILFQRHIVIHCEESEAAYQHFYPLSLLREYTTRLATKDAIPAISCRLPPARTLKKKFIFPPFAFSDSDQEQDPEGEEDDAPATIVSATSLRMSGAVHGISEDEERLLTSPMENHVVAGPSTSTPGPSTVVSSSFSSLASALSSSASTAVPPPQPPQENPNPYPFPPWYPESAHFVRQWWPSLPNIPRVSCTVVLLAAHDQHTHRTRFVLAQHYFRVPLDRKRWENEEAEEGEHGASSLASESVQPIKNGLHGKQSSGKPTMNGKAHHRPPSIEEIQDDALMQMWYVSTPFEVVRVFDGQEEEDDGTFTERPRPLVAVDFGHAVWVEYIESDEDQGEDDDDDDMSEEEEGPGTSTTTTTTTMTMTRRGFNAAVEDDEEMMMEATTSTAPPVVTTPSTDNDPKRLRFVTFPPFLEDSPREVPSSHWTSSCSTSYAHATHNNNNNSNGKRSMPGYPPGVVHTLPTPPGLHLGLVETINIDQSQGAVILSDKSGKIWILCYD